MIKISQLRSFVTFSMESRIYTLAVRVEFFLPEDCVLDPMPPGFLRDTAPLIITFKPFSSLASFPSTPVSPVLRSPSFR